MAPNLTDGTGTLYIIATPIGNLADLSDRAKNILSQLAWVAVEDTRHSANLFRAIGVSPECVSYHEHNERSRVGALIERLKNGVSGGLVSDAGTPLINDPGYVLVREAHDAGIPVVPIPGACSPIVALSASGLPTDRFLFEGFLPAKSGQRLKRLTQLQTFPHTMVFLEAPHRVRDFLRDTHTIFGGERVICIARELTKKYESIKRMTLGQAQTALKNEIPEKGEFVMVIEGDQSPIQSSSDGEITRVLTILLARLPLKQAVEIAVELVGCPRNLLYERAVQIRGMSS